jgi:O-antigen biosynthesis protein
VIKRKLKKVFYKFFNKRYKPVEDLSVLTQIDKFHIDTQHLRTKTSYKIAFIIPDMKGHSGGHTAILKLGTALAEYGHEIFYITYKNMSVNSMRENAKVNTSSYKGSFLKLDEIKNTVFDIGVSTFWLSAYYLLKYDKNFLYKMSYLLDFESSFYALGDDYLLANQTYNMGFHLVSLGAWNQNQVKDFFPNSRCDRIDFPIDISNYPIIEREILIEKSFDVAIYIKQLSKRAPDFLVVLMHYLTKAFEQNGYQINFKVIGMSQRIVIDIGENMGTLTHDELKRLYERSHFGIVASMSNISLVNYEMIACGLPVVDFYEGSAPTFFTEDEMIFVPLEPQKIFEKLLYYIENQDKLNTLVKKGQEKFRNESLSWDQSANQFNQILKKTAR